MSHRTAENQAVAERSPAEYAMSVAGLRWSTVERKTGYKRSYLRDVFRKGTPVMETSLRIRRVINAALEKTGFDGYLNPVALRNPHQLKGTGTARILIARPAQVEPEEW